MSNIDTTKLVALGEKLMVNCPDNDCIIYRNTYVMWDELTEDITRAKSKHSKRILRNAIDKLEREMYMMYIDNYAVSKYLKAAQNAQ